MRIRQIAITWTNFDPEPIDYQQDLDFYEELGQHIPDGWWIPHVGLWAITLIFAIAMFCV